MMQSMNDSLLCISLDVTSVKVGVPRWHSHRCSGLATLPSVGAVP